MRSRQTVPALLTLVMAAAAAVVAQSPRDATGTPAVVDRLEMHATGQPAKIPFEVRRIDAGTVETGLAVDVNVDKQLDIVAGDSWYEGPGWTKRVFREVPIASGYVDAFSDFAVDVDDDARPDLVTFHYFGRAVAWYRNPGPAGGEWARTHIDTGFSTEFARLVDITGDGRALELLPQTTSRTSPLSWYELVKGAWVKHTIDGASHPHGIGAGDINGDGRSDVLTPAGWFEAPPDPRQGPWVRHDAWATLGLPELGFMHVLDVNRDGRTDVLTTAAHNYGVFWLEQLAEGAWRWHQIDRSWSEAHPSVLVDLDQNGTMDLVTAKRYMGRNAGAPGANEPLGVYWYEFRPDGPSIVWTRHTVAFDKGVGGGLQMTVVDVDKDDDVDIIAPGKTGLFLIENKKR
jgi:hypothetical protein